MISIEDIYILTYWRGMEELSPNSDSRSQDNSRTRCGYRTGRSNRWCPCTGQCTGHFYPGSSLLSSHSMNRTDPGFPSRAAGRPVLAWCGFLSPSPRPTSGGALWWRPASKPSTWLICHKEINRTTLHQPLGSKFQTEFNLEHYAPSRSKK